MKYEKTILKDFPDNSVFCAFVGIPWNNELLMLQVLQVISGNTFQKLGI